MNQSAPCSADCPDAAQLRQLLAEGLSAADEAELVHHLDTCSSCQTNLEAMANAKASFNVRGASGERPPASSAFWPAVQRLENLALSDTTPLSDVHSADDVSLSFL